MNSFHENDVFQKCDYTTQNIDKNVIVIPKNVSIPSIVLNGTAFFILELLDGSRSNGDVISLMIERYSISVERATNDLSLIYADLEGKGIIVKI
jgi:methyltransferase-like protein